MIAPYVLFALLAVCVLGISGVLWGSAAMRLLTGRAVLRCERRQPVPWGFVDLLLLVVFYIVAGAIAAAVITALQIPSPRSEQATSNDRIAWLAIQMLVQTLATLLAITVTAIRNRCRAADLGFRLRDMGDDLRIGVAAFVMLAPPVFLIQALMTRFYPYEHALIELVKSDPRLLLASGVSAVLIAPVSEELQFRVLLQGWLEKCAVWRGNGRALLTGGRMDAASLSQTHIDESESDAEGEAPTWPAEVVENPYAPPLANDSIDAGGEGARAAAERELAPTPHWWPILISAFIFAAMHASAWPSPVPLFVLGLGLGYLYRQTHRVLPSITVHLLLNATTMVILALSIYFPAPS
jgi:membrane protease YdiL (CAAX protease family)